MADRQTLPLVRNVLFHRSAFWLLFVLSFILPTSILPAIAKIRRIRRKKREQYRLHPVVDPQQSIDFADWPSEAPFE